MLLILCLWQKGNAQQNSPLYVNQEQIAWVDSTYNALSLDEKIGQLFMVAAYSNKGTAHEAQIKNLIQKEKIGGLIFMQDNPRHQVELTNEYQSLSKIPLLIGMDAEWDVSMRLKNTNKFPWAMTMGALQNNDLIYAAGEKIAEHLDCLGAHFNFAPDIDVNVNANNPVIGNRSFGSNPNNVAQKGYYMMKGMQDQSILASAKHFPGHGDTDKDSHKTLPSILHNKERLEKIELAPFQSLIDQGVTAIMVAHLSVPALEPNPKIPASLSKKIVTDLLKNKMGFKGIIITDALNMSGITNHYPNGQSDYMAFEAGNDILLFSQAVSVGKNKIKSAINSGKIPMKRLEESVKKILMGKYYVGLNHYRPIEDDYLTENLNDAQSKSISYEIFEKATTLLKNENNILPIKELKDKRFAWLPLEESSHSTVGTYLNKYTQVDRIKGTESDLSKYDCIFITTHKSNETPFKSYKISKASRDLIARLSAKYNVVLSVFGSPYGLKNIDTKNLKGLLVAYQNTTAAQEVVPQIIFGALGAKGMLPVDVAPYKAGDFITIQAIDRLGYTLPENVGIDSEYLKKIDQIAQNAINAKATPGMQVLAARNGKVFLDKSYGYQTYQKKNKVKWNDLYDIASITKITATLPLLMEEVEQNKLSLSSTIKDLYPEAGFSNKSGMTIKEVLAHQAGLYPWIPFYKSTLDSVSMARLPQFYSSTPSKEFNRKVADGIYAKKDMDKFILDQILLKENVSKRYKYSDLGYYFFKNYLEKKNHSSLAFQDENTFYSPLGMNYTTFNPLDKFKLNQIAPTENDYIFRKEQIRGYVHDQGAAMMGGIAGHAGLFSNANDLAKIMQMYLNGGTYGGQRFLKEETLKEFTSYQFSQNRRGLGFDKQLGNKGPSILGISPNSFGHTGFTGTMVWADPQEQIVYVFLSNRVYPNADNRKLIRMNTREDIQKVLYDAITRTNKL